VEELMDEYKLSESEIAALKQLHRSLTKKREADRVYLVEKNCLRRWFLEVA
jgi:hypothetical protein